MHNHAVGSFRIFESASPDFQLPRCSNVCWMNCQVFGVFLYLSCSNSCTFDWHWKKCGNLSMLLNLTEYLRFNTCSEIIWDQEFNCKIFELIPTWSLQSVVWGCHLNFQHVVSTVALTKPEIPAMPHNIRQWKILIQYYHNPASRVKITAWILIHFSSRTSLIYFFKVLTYIVFTTGMCAVFSMHMCLKIRFFIPPFVKHKAGNR